MESFTYSTAEIDQATNHALATLAWSSSDGDGTPLDTLNAEWTDEARATVRATVESFMTPDDDGLLADMQAHHAPESLGYDFVLTVNRHGSGFWDRGHGDAGERLTQWAHTFGEIDAYVTNDGALEVIA